MEAYDFYRNYNKQPPLTLERFLRHDSTLLKELAQENPSFDNLKKMHAGRLFALAVLPLARSTGYTHLILEGFDETDPAKTLARSKDRAGDLLRITMACHWE